MRILFYSTLHTYARYSFQKAEIEVKRNSTHLQNYIIVINLQMNPSKEWESWSTYVYKLLLSLPLMQRNRLRHKILSISQKGMNTQVQKIEFIVLKIKPLRSGSWPCRKAWRCLLLPKYKLFPWSMPILAQLFLRIDIYFWEQRFLHSHYHVYVL